MCENFANSPLTNVRHNEGWPVAVLPEHDPSHSPPSNIGGVVLSPEETILHYLVPWGQRVISSQWSGSQNYTVLFFSVYVRKDPDQYEYATLPEDPTPSPLPLQVKILTQRMTSSGRSGLALLDRLTAWPAELAIVIPSTVTLNGSETNQTKMNNNQQ